MQHHMHESEHKSMTKLVHVVKKTIVCYIIESIIYLRIIILYIRAYINNSHKAKHVSCECPPVHKHYSYQ